MFWKVRAIPARAFCSGVLPVMSSPREADPPGARPEDARDQIEGRRLARAVRANQADELALGDAEVDAVQRADAAEALAEFLDFKQSGVWREAIVRPWTGRAEFISPSSALPLRKRCSSEGVRLRTVKQSSVRRGGEGSSSGVGQVRKLLPAPAPELLRTPPDGLVLPCR